MEKIVKTMYPGCDKDVDAPNGCFERFLRDRLDNMKNYSISHLVLEEFDETHTEVFKRVFEDRKDFWWHVRSHNNGTVKDKWVYSIDLFIK